MSTVCPRNTRSRAIPRMKPPFNFKHVQVATRYHHYIYDTILFRATNNYHKTVVNDKKRDLHENWQAAREESSHSLASFIVQPSGSIRRWSTRRRPCWGWALVNLRMSSEWRTMRTWSTSVGVSNKIGTLR